MPSIINSDISKIRFLECAYKNIFAFQTAFGSYNINKVILMPTHGIFQAVQISSAKRRITRRKRTPSLFCIRRDRSSPAKCSDDWVTTTSGETIPTVSATPSLRLPLCAAPRSGHHGPHGRRTSATRKKERWT